MIMAFEGLSLDAYLCPAGVWTIGYGHTLGVHAGMHITDQEARRLLIEDLFPVEVFISHLDLGLSQNRFDALCSLAFNIGLKRFASSTLLSKVKNNASDLSIGREFKRWIYAGGKKMEGLLIRRGAESKLYYE